MPSTILFRKSELIDNLERVRKRLHYAQLHYAVKANGEREVLEVLHLAGVGFEAASVEEFDRLSSIGVESERILCGLPVKGPSCRYFVFDHAAEFDDLRSKAPDAKKILRLYISDLDPESPGWGMDHGELRSCREKFPCFFEQIHGLTFHIARNYRTKTIAKVFDRIEDWLGEINRDSTLILNIGGGYRDQLPLHLALKHDQDKFYDALAQRIAGLRERFSLDVYCEPGRAIVEAAGYLQTEAMQVKTTEQDAIEVVLDLNIGRVPGAHPREISVILDDGRESLYDLEFHINCSKEPHVMCSFVDATCEYGVFYKLPIRRAIQPTEQLEFAGLGAYTTCQSSNFHARTFPRVRVV